MERRQKERNDRTHRNTRNQLIRNLANFATSCDVHSIVEESIINNQSICSYLRHMSIGKHKEREIQEIQREVNEQMKEKICRSTFESYISLFFVDDRNERNERNDSGEEVLKILLFINSAAINRQWYCFPVGDLNIHHAKDVVVFLPCAWNHMGLRQLLMPRDWKMHSNEKDDESSNPSFAAHSSIPQSASSNVQ